MDINSRAFITAIACLVVARVSAQESQGLSSLGVEDLLKLKVTTASKQSQDLLHVSAAIYVITQEDIRRAGAQSVPEALRMAPGVDVAQLDANKWMISIRGFNNRFANKLLVLVDGRTIYTPLFSGVYWDQQEVNIEDVDRIEVIRGPGGTLWGANAVNGIINVITKRAVKTQGTAISTRTSSTEPTTDTIRHGGQLGPTAFYRVYAKYLDVDSLKTIAATHGSDAWHALSGGFRADWNTQEDSYTVTSGISSERAGDTSAYPAFTPPYTQLITDRFAATSWNLQANWERTTGRGKGSALRISMDHVRHDMPESREARDTFAVDYQRPWRVSQANNLIWGLGFSSTRDGTVASEFIRFSPAEAVLGVWSGFVNDEIDLNNALKLSLGSKVENNTYTGWEFQPSARMIWTQGKRQSFWASVSRAVRTPSMGDVRALIDAEILPGPGGTPVEIRVTGNPDFKSEVVVAHEIGWRIQPSDRLFVDFAAFYNKYTNLRSVMAGTAFAEMQPVFHIVQPMDLVNGLHAETAGLEIASDYQATRKWKVALSASMLSTKFRYDPGLQEPSGNPSSEGEGSAPRMQFNVRSMLNLPSHLSWDTDFYYVDKLAFDNVARFGRLDMRLAWHPQDSVEWSVGAQNILNVHHVEGLPQIFEVPAFIERNVYAQLSLKF